MFAARGQARTSKSSTAISCNSVAFTKCVLEVAVFLFPFLARAQQDADLSVRLILVVLLFNPSRASQLKGGIEAYLKEHSDTGGFWRGKNFVFDKREAVGVENPDGDGGVIRRKDKKATKKKNIETTCILCQTPWDRYVGKKKCDTCGVPVLMCDACMSSHHKRKGKNSNEEGGDSQNLLVRCPLCVEEGVTVRVADVEYTNNGVTSRAATAAAVATVGENDRAHKNETLTSCSVFKKEGTADIKKAAPSVLKWGGGHASQKKTKRRLRHRMCKFGADCRRQDCFFRHPGDGTNVPT